MSKILKGSGGGGGGDSDNLFSTDVVETVLAVSEGPVQGIKDASFKNVYLNGVPHTAKDGTLNFAQSNFQVIYDVGGPNPKPIDYNLSGSSSVIAVGQVLAKDSPVVKVLPNGAGTSFTHIEVRIMINSLLRYKDDGAYKHSVEFEVEWSKASEGIWHPVGGQSATKVITAKTSSGAAVEYTSLVDPDGVTLDGSDTYSVRVTKRSEDSTDKKITDISFGGVNLVLSSSYTTPETHPNLAFVHFFGRLGDQITGTPKITAVWQGILCSVPSNYNWETKTYNESSPWDGQFLAEKKFTNNPFWLIRELALNTRFGLASTLKYLSVNDYELYALAKHADELVPDGVLGETQPRFTFNGVIDKPMDGLELLNYIAGSCFARVFDDNQGQLRIVADRDDASVMLITPESVVAQGEVKFSYSKTDLRKRANEFFATYVDPDMDWQAQKIYLKDDAAIARFGRIRVNQQLVGCTNRHEGYRKLKYLITTAQTEVLNVSFTLPMSGITLEPYQVIDIADPVMGWALAGRVWSLVGTTLTLRDPLIFDAAGTFTVKLQSATQGVISRTFTIAVAGQYNEVTLSSPVPETLPKHCPFSMEGATGLGFAKPFRILRIDEVNGLPDVYSVTAIELNRNKFGDSDNAIITDGAIPAPVYGFKAAVVVKPVENITTSELRNDRDGYIDLTVSWTDPNPGGLNPYYEVSLYRGGQLVRTRKVDEETCTFESVLESEFEISVKVGNSMGSASSEVQGFSPAYEDAVSIAANWATSGTGLITGGFSDGDLVFNAKLTIDSPVQVGLVIDLISEPTTRSYIAEIIKTSNSSVLMTLESTDGNFNYTSALNIAQNTTPLSDLTVKIYVMDISGTQSQLLKTKVFSSDGIPVITGVNITPVASGVKASLTTDELLTQSYLIEWAVSTTNNTGFLDANIIGVGEVLNVSSLEGATQYYLWVRITSGFAQIYPATLAGSGFTTLAGASSSDPRVDPLLAIPKQVTITSIVKETNGDLTLTVDTQASDNSTHYEIWRSVKDENNYELLETVPTDNVADDSAFIIVDSEYAFRGLVYYKAFAVNLQTYSVVAKDNFNALHDLPDPSSLVVATGAFQFALTWVNVNNPMLKEVEIWKEARVTSSGFLEANAVKVYAGLSTSFTYEVPAVDYAKHHKFWLKSIEQT